jgi:hypothetical protein
MRGVAIGTLLSCLLAGPLLAGQTGEIRGTVSDEHGLALPDVLVTAKSASLQGQRTVLSEASGFFRLPLLPVGTYELTFEREGFEKLTLTGFQIRLGHTVTLPVSMKLSGFATEITVAAETPLIDVTSADTSYRLRGAELRSIPSQARTIAEVVALTPGVTGVRTDTVTGTDTGLPSFRGEGDAGNNWLVDGLSTKGVSTNDPGVRINYDAWEEVQVVSDGFAPELGQALGGFVNVVTKSGGNSFHGELGALIRANGLRAGREEQLSVASLPETSLGQYYANLGGPIVKDKLWFFLSNDFFTEQHTSSQESIGWLTIPGGERSAKTNNTFGKLTFTPRTNHTLSLSATGDTFLAGSGGIGVPETYTKSDFDNASIRLNYMGILGRSVLVTAAAGLNRRDSSTDPGPGGYGPASYFWQDIAQRTNNIEKGTASSERREDLALGVSWFRETERMGRHELKAGLSAYHNSFQETWRWTGRDFDPWPGNDFDGGSLVTWAGPGLPLSLAEYQTGSTDDSSRGVGLYLQDTITWGRLSLMLGLRTDSQQVLNDAGDVVWSWGPGDFLQPRVGLTFDLTGDGRTVLKAAYGQFAMPIGAQYLTWVNKKWLVNFRNYAWVGPADPSPAQLSDPGSWELQWEQSNGGTPLAVDPKLRPNRAHRVLVGLERRLAAGWAVKLRGIYSRSNDLMEDLALYDPAAPAGFQYLFTNFEAKKRDYRAREVELNGRVQDKLALNASYTWSSARGSTPGNSFESGGGYDGGPFGDRPNMPASDPNAELYAFLFEGLGGRGAGAEGWYGALPYNVDHDVKVLATYYAPHRFTVSLSFEWLSGYPWEKRGWSNGYGAYLTFPEGRGGRTTPSLTYVDLAAQKEFRLKNDVFLALGVNVNNLFNSQQPVSYIKEDTELLGRVWARQLPRWVQLTASLRF